MCLSKETNCKYCNANYAEDTIMRIERVGVDYKIKSVYDNSYKLVVAFHKREECIKT